MIKNIEELKNKRPDLVDSFEKMDKEQLLNQCYLECIDGLNMENRVSLFMQECTNNMSNTNYTLKSIKELIVQKKELDIKIFCQDTLEDNKSNKDIASEIKRIAKE